MDTKDNKYVFATNAADIMTPVELAVMDYVKSKLMDRATVIDALREIAERKLVMFDHDVFAAKFTGDNRNCISEMLGRECRALRKSVAEVLAPVGEIFEGDPLLTGFVNKTIAAKWASAVAAKDLIEWLTSLGDADAEFREAEKAANLLRHTVHPSYYPLCSVHFDWEGSKVVAEDSLSDGKCLVRIEAPRKFLETVWKNLCTDPIPADKQVAVTPRHSIEPANYGMFYEASRMLGTNDIVDADPAPIMERLSLRGVALVDNASAISANIDWKVNKLNSDKPCAITANFTTDFAKYSVMTIV